MLKYDREAMLALAANYDNRSVYLSGFSYAVLLATADTALPRWVWSDMTDSQWDETDALLNNMVSELMADADVGTVVALMTDVIPQRFLLCDGGTYNREDYPNLYNVLPASLKPSADTFTLPDMAGLAAVGASFSRPLLTVFGAETHTLTEAEMPTHSHTYTPAVADLDLEDVGVPTPAASVGVIPALTGTAGGGLAHNNIQPSISLYWCIVAR